MLRKIIFPLMLVFASVATSFAQEQRDTPVSKQELFNQPPDTLRATFPQDSSAFMGGKKPFYFSHGHDRYTVRPAMAQILKKDFPNSGGAYMEFERIEVYDLFDGSDEYRGSIPFNLTHMDPEDMQKFIVTIFQEELELLNAGGDSYYLVPPKLIGH